MRASLYKVRGVNLIELLIAMTISTLLLLVASTVMVQNRQDYEPVRDLVRINDNVRTVLDLVAKDVRSTGSFGEYAAFGDRAVIQRAFRNNMVAPGNPNSLLNLAENTAQGGALEGYDGNAGGGWRPSGGTALDNGLALSALSGVTDAITLRGSLGGEELFNVAGNRVGNAQPLTAPMGNVADPLRVNNVANFPQQGFFAVYNRRNIDLFRGQVNLGANTVTYVGGANPGGSATLERTYTNNIAGDVSRSGPAYVTPLNFVRYYVSNFPGTATPTLFREQIAGDASIVQVPLLQGVEDMQITYQQRNADGGLSNFLTANNVTDWKNIIAVRIGLLVRSETQSAKIQGLSDRAYQVNDRAVNVTANDRFFRRAFHVTIPIGVKL